jgi:4'-phosphopantetheinyl transferase
MTKAEVLVVAAHIDMLAGRDEESLLRPMPSGQAESIRRNRRAEDRCRRILARLLLAYGLSVLEGWDIGAGLAALRSEPGGRPWLEGCARPVSLSHAGHWAVCAIGHTEFCQAIGVDVEQIRELAVEDFRVVFTPAEQQAVRNSKKPHSELIRRWTIKEAILKARGTGLLADPLDIDTGDAEVAGVAGWHWEHLPLEHGYWLTVAGQSSCTPSRLLVPSRTEIFPQAVDEPQRILRSISSTGLGRSSR